MKNKELFSAFIRDNNLEDCVSENQPLKDYTIIKTGGAADFFVAPSNLENLQKIFSFICSNNFEYKIIGNGSNLLISDKGYDGIVLTLKKIPKKLYLERSSLFVSANIDTPSLLMMCIKWQMSGLEFLTGIPGSVGGMVEMNAGAFDHTIGNILHEIIIINEQGELERILATNIEFNYRKINIRKRNYIIYEAVFNMKKDAQYKIQNLCNQYLARRSSRFLLNALTFGSVFKNGNGYFAGELLEKCELKGYKIGNAQISKRHANFIINPGNATSTDIFNLIKIMKQRVKEKFDVELIPEVRLWGDFSDAI